MPTSTEIFINSELPKRPYTNQFPLTAGHVPVATGVGLEVEARILSASDISDMSSYATQGDLSNVLADANEYADGLVVGLWDDRGAYTVNAAGNINYPSSAGSGVAGALMKGDIFTVAGAVTGVSTINNIAVNNGDTVRALVDNPSATDNAHWVIAENNIGYVPENTANKTTNTDLSGAAGTYPDTPTVKSYIDNYDISAAAINSTGTVTLTRTESDLTFQVPTAISGLSFDPNTGVLTSSYTNNAVDTIITVAANEVSDNVFRIKDDTDATKKIAFQASNIGAGQTKTISMPNFDVYLTPIRRRIQTSGSGLENLLLNNTETYIEITGGTTITIPVYPPYTVNAGASGYLFNATNTVKIIRFQHTWSGEISSFDGKCNHYFPETNETGGYTSTAPGSSGNTYTEIQLLPGETLRFVVSGTKTFFTVNIYRNSSNVMYENTFKIKSSALESYGVRFDTSAVTTDRVITMPDADVDLGNVAQAASTSTDGYLTSTDWNTFNGKQNALADVITANTYGSSTQYPIVTVNAKGIVTGITLQTVPTPTFTDATFAVQKNGSPSISATWSLTEFTVSHVHTYPDKDINFGDVPSVASTNSNSLSTTSTACTIAGGYGNTVNTGAYGCSIVASKSSTVNTNAYMAAIVASYSGTINTAGSYDGYNAIMSSYSCTINGTNTGITAAIASGDCTLSASYTAVIASSSCTLSGPRQVAIGSGGLTATTWPLKYSVALGAANSLVAPHARRIYAPLHGILGSPTTGNTLNATTDESPTPSEANCLRLFVDSTSQSSYTCSVFHVTITVAVKTAINTVRAYKSLRTVTVIYGDAAYVTNTQETIGTDVDYNLFSTYYSVAITVDSANRILYPVLTVLGTSGDGIVTMSCFVEADYHF